jgi:hypothetical protein
MKSIRSGSVWIILSAVIIYSCYSVHYYQFENLPSPLTAEQAGKRGFSEIQAIKHVKALTDFGPHPVGSDSLDLALQVYLFTYSFILFYFILFYLFFFFAVCFGGSGEYKEKRVL